MSNYHTKLVTAATAEPVSLDELKAHAVIDFDDDDAHLPRLIRAARGLFESETGLVLVEQEWLIAFEGFTHYMTLPIVPLRSVEAVRYFDVDGVKQTLDPATYQVEATGLMPQLSPARNTTWPSVDCYKRMPVEVTVKAGYVAAKSSKPHEIDPATGELPEEAKIAIMTLAAHWYENRAASAEVNLADTPLTFKSIVDNMEVLR